MLQRIVTVLLVAVAALVLAALWIRWSEPRLIYYPTRALEVTPDRLGLRYEEVWPVAADGVRLHAWFLPCPSDAPPPPGRSAARPAWSTARPTVLFLHGNAGNISHRFEKLAVLHDLGADVLLLDYRGYGLSEGSPDEAGTYRDGLAAYEHLTRGCGLDPRTLVLYGESLGSAVAVELASRVPVGGVVLEAAFTSIADVGQALYPFLPVRRLVRNRYDSLGKIARVRAPLLLLHSRDDEYFPMRHAERLLAAATAPKRLVELRGSHNDAFRVSDAGYRAALARFLAAVDSAKPQPGQDP